MGGKQTSLTLRKEGKSDSLNKKWNISNTPILIVQNTTTSNDRSIVRVVKKIPQITLTDIMNNLQKGGMILEESTMS